MVGYYARVRGIESGRNRLFSVKNPVFSNGFVFIKKFLCLLEHPVEGPVGPHMAPHPVPIRNQGVLYHRNTFRFFFGGRLPWSAPAKRWPPKTMQGV